MYLSPCLLISLFRSTLPWELIACTVLGMVVWLAIIYSIRYTLKVLLMYKGWMYEQRGKGRVISTRTKIWFFLIKMFSGGSKPLLYSYQGSLPRLSLPSLKDTMTRVSVFITDSFVFLLR
jgi:carnitine O-palmitoyltransferase 1